MTLPLYALVGRIFYNDFMSFQVEKEVYEFRPEIHVVITFGIS
jgi:hypothetical protein